jgi:hypothetical protein
MVLGSVVVKPSRNVDGSGWTFVVDSVRVCPPVGWTADTGSVAPAQNTVFRHRSFERLRFIWLGLVACVASVLAIALTVAPATASAAGSCPVSAMTGAAQPACWKPFTAASPFNTELPSHPVLLSDSSTIVDRMISRHWTIDGQHKRFQFSPRWYGTRPVFFAEASDPVMTIECKENPAEGLCTGANGVDVSGMKIHVPAGVRPDPNADAHLTVIEAGTGDEYDFWDTTIAGSTISAKTAAVVNVNAGSGLGSQGDAAQFGLSAGLVRPSELASGQIDHALVVTVPCTNGSGSKAGFTWPAEGGWGSACGPNGSELDKGVPAMGQLLQLNMTDAQIRKSGAPAWQQTIMTALAHYGAYVEDTDGSAAQGIDILAQSSSSWTDLGQSNHWSSVISRLHGSNDDLISNVPIPLRDLQVVNPCVSKGTCP